jgi:uncharacterized protein (UPF0332 family)
MYKKREYIYKGGNIMDAFDLRNKGDYGAMHAVPKEKADQLISDAGDLFDAVESWLFPGKKPRQA